MQVAGHANVWRATLHCICAWALGLGTMTKCVDTSWSSDNPAGALAAASKDDVPSDFVQQAIPGLL